jgi:hypothetical protein
MKLGRDRAYSDSGRYSARSPGAEGRRHEVAGTCPTLTDSAEEAFGAGPNRRSWLHDRPPIPIIKRYGALAVRNAAAMARDCDDFEFFACRPPRASRGEVRSSASTSLPLRPVRAAGPELDRQQGPIWAARFADAIAERGPVTLGSMRRREGKSIDE